MEHITGEFTEKEIIAMPDLRVLRAMIDSLNRDIVLSLSLRREFPRNLHLYEPGLDSRLMKLGVDAGATEFLLPIYSKICNHEKNEKYLRDIAKADVLVQSKINERVLLGRPVAMWKYYRTSSEKITYRAREQAVLNQVAELAVEYKLDKEEITEVFNEIIMPRTKSLEHAVMSEMKKRSSTKTKVLARTACADIVPVLISQLGYKQGNTDQFRIKKFREESGVTLFGVYLAD